MLEQQATMVRLAPLRTCMLFSPAAGWGWGDAGRVLRKGGKGERHGGLRVWNADVRCCCAVAGRWRVGDQGGSRAGIPLCDAPGDSPTESAAPWARCMHPHEDTLLGRRLLEQHCRVSCNAARQRCASNFSPMIQQVQRWRVADARGGPGLRREARHAHLMFAYMHTVLC